MDSLDIDMRNILVDFNTKLLYFFGIFRHEFASKSYFFAYTCRVGLFLGFFFGGVVLCELINLYHSLKNLEALAQGCFLTLTNLLTTYKFYTMLRHRQKIMRLVSNLNRPEFKPENKYQYISTLGYMRRSWMVSAIMATACCSTCMCWILVALSEGGRSLIISAWLPFSIEPVGNYVVVFVFTSIGTLIGGIADQAVHFFIAGMIMVVAQQLHNLNNKLSNIQQEPNASSMNDQLIECIKHHHIILQFLEEYQSIFSGCLLGQLVVGVPPGGLRFFAMVFYSSCILGELFVICYNGNEVIIESDNLSDSVYNCGWIDSSIEFKKNLYYLMIRAKVPTKVYAGGYFTLSLETFINILKSSYSYFSVLIQMNEPNV